MTIIGETWSTASCSYGISPNRKKAEESLRESEEKYSELAELLPLMIFELDTDFRITCTNRHAHTVFEFTDRDIEQGINALLFIEPP